VGGRDHNMSSRSLHIGGQNCDVGGWDQGVGGRDQNMAALTNIVFGQWNGMVSSGVGR
jgi:hypothetical protein